MFAPKQPNISLFYVVDELLVSSFFRLWRRGWLSGLDGEDAWERTARPGSEAEADISWKVGYGTVEAVAECSVGMGVEIAVDAEEEVAVIIYGSCFESEIGREQPGVVVVNLLERVL